MDFPREIYAIQHNVTKKIYIGSSKNATTRCMSHMSALRNGTHINEDMQSDFDIYGEDYSFFILEKVTDTTGRYKEYEWMQKYRSTERSIGYNYKDHIAKKVIVPTCHILFQDGMPTISETQEETSRKEQLLELIENLSESQISYIYTLAQKLFKGGEL